MAECFYCGRRFPMLYKLTTEDIQREHLGAEAFQVACGECLDRIRKVSHLVPDQSLGQVSRNFALMVPVFAVALVSISMIVSSLGVLGLSGLGPSSQWLGIAAVFVGTLMTWDRLKNRYGFTHDLRWSLNSKSVNYALSIVFAGVFVAVLATQFLK